MKFKIGQPVWLIPHCSGTLWKPSVVIGVYSEWDRTRCCVCNSIILHGTIYQIEGNGTPPGGYQHWAAAESFLRPRDPDQFEPAEEGFELKIKERA